MRELLRCPPAGLGLLAVGGKDARRFLHAQTTQRIDDLPPSGTRLAAWLNAKGRVLALFDVIPDQDQFLLLMPADLLDTVVAGFSRYQLRDAVTFQSDTRRATVLVGDSSSWLAGRGIDLPDAGVAHLPAMLFARLSPRLVIAIGDDDLAAAGLADVSPGFAVDVEREWIRMGRPAIPASLSGRYIPQMLNLDLLEAISFTKGCYPGQEIVARSHHLGEVKRRLRSFTATPGRVPSPGEPIVDASGSTVGDVNRAAVEGQSIALLAVVPVDAAAGTLSLRADGRAIT